jgi:EAL domain-containing protein (putative c-di-GMP-specific phosphodiesterase class I)
MDDFGSGYSSLNMLKDEHVDEIKMDKAFIDDMDSEKSKIVVRNMINMIGELGINLIAEGVETQRQADFLIENGCYRAQGYYYYKPMPIDEFGKLL